MPIDTLSLKIGGSAFRYWESAEIVIGIDTHPALSLSTPFEPDHADFRSLFRPFSFVDVEAWIDDERLFKGFLLGPDPDASPGSRIASVHAYSRAAVLLDTTLPPSLAPFQFDGLKLADIARRVCDPLDVDVIDRVNDTAKFRRVRAEIGEKAEAFLVELTRQRGTVLTSNEDGALVIQQSVAAGAPVARLRTGAPPLAEVAAQFNHQEFYSDVTGYVPTKAGRVGAKYTVINPFLTSVTRSLTFRVDDTDKGDIRAAVYAKMGRMFGNVVIYTARVPTWRDGFGSIWRPNTTITLYAPEVMVYRETELLIREVRLSQDGGNASADLTMCLPGAFSGEVPASLPWEE